MAPVETTGLMTTEQLLAMPDDGVERWLIRGQLRQRPLIVRNRWHGRTMIRLGYLLESWRRSQAEPRGSVLGGQVGVRLSRDPDTTVGIDLIYISAEMAAQHPDESALIDGVPVLAVEILSPNNTFEQIDEKIDRYLAAGVLLIWIIKPRHRTVTIYRPAEGPELVNVRQELSGEPHLPGFRVPVAELFV